MAIPKELSYERSFNPDGSFKALNLCIVWENASTQDINLLKEIVGTPGTYEGVLLSMNKSGDLTVTHPSNAPTNPLVESKILFESEKSQGDIIGGTLTYTCQDVDNDVNICLKGAGNTENNLQFGLKDEFHVSIIGVDDIRARKKEEEEQELEIPHYSQLFLLQDQALFLQLEKDPNNSNNFYLSIKYKKHS